MLRNGWEGSTRMVEMIMTIILTAAKNQGQKYRTRPTGDASGSPQAKCEAAWRTTVKTQPWTAEMGDEHCDAGGLGYGKTTRKVGGQGSPSWKVRSKEMRGSRRQRARGNKVPTEDAQQWSVSSSLPRFYILAPPLTSCVTLSKSLTLPSCFFICKIRLIWVRAFYKKSTTPQTAIIKEKHITATTQNFLILFYCMS